MHELFVCIDDSYFAEEMLKQKVVHISSFLFHLNAYQYGFIVHLTAARVNKSSKLMVPLCLVW